MTQEEKQLLLKDLCARLPYEVKVDHFGTVKELLGIMPSSENVMVGYDINDYEDSIIEDIKPYLRPMSSMTEEEKEKFNEFIVIVDDIWKGDLKNGFPKQSNIMSDSIDYLTSIHIDYRGLIPKGLAIPVTKENNPYKNYSYDTKR